MSRASAAVLFPDGVIKFAIYCGTTDKLWPRLFDTNADAWDAYAGTKHGQLDYQATFYPPSELPADSGEAVRIFANYGHGSEWGGRATRDFVVSNLYPDEIDGVREIDAPDWLVWA